MSMTTSGFTIENTTENSREQYDTGNTIQAFDAAPAPSYKNTDAEQIRDYFSIPPLEVADFTSIHDDAICYPDMVIHERTPTRAESHKATDCLFRGDRDCGKTTMALNLSVRLMDENDERVIWRGRRGGAGWLPYRYWTTLYLPAGVDVDARWMQDGEISVDDAGTSVNPETVVRDVVYYDGIYDLLRSLGERKPGTFNVVYPDPLFRDCEAITRDTDRGQFAGGLPFTPERDSGPDTEATPRTDWWVPFLVARAENGPWEWTSWICDEAGDLFPEHARNDDDRPLHDLIGLLRATWATSRKRYLSLYMFIHYEENLHHNVRREFKWRVHMPDGSSNPTENRVSTHPIGFEGDVPMKSDLMGDEDIGTALCYTKDGFTYVEWGDISSSGEDAKRWVSIRLDADSDGSNPGPNGVEPRSSSSGSSARGGGGAD